ncbi:hypothetical protein ACVOMT_04550 [Sphingomonas panni]
MMNCGTEGAATGRVTIPALDKATGYPNPEQYRTERWADRRHRQPRCA